MLGFCEEVGVMSLRQCGAVVIGVVMCASGVLIAGAEKRARHQFAIVRR